ncbi:MAG: metallophosphoesterase [Saprospiraceae bacterium]
MKHLRTFQSIGMISLLLWPFLLSAQKFEFAMIGDMPYQEADVVKFENLIEALNGDRRVKWVMHTGDIKTGDTPCTDEYFQNRFDLYQKIKKPFIITPGDNEWTDCHRNGAGKYDPLERLGALRALFFKDSHHSLGQHPMPLESQKDLAGFENYPENQRWEKHGVWFATCHVVGSQNGMAPFAGRTGAHDQEVADRTQAAIYWLKETFDKAKDDKGVLIMIHANPHLEQAADSVATKGFYAFLTALEEAVIRFGKPVLFVHGDSHYFRYDKPLLDRKTKRRIENFTRLEVFGASDVHWVKVVVNPKDPNVFQVRQELVRANFERH